jgi:hypothetical protein
MLRDWGHQARLSLARLKVEHPLLEEVPSFPRFRATLLIVWIIAIGSFFIGRSFSVGHTSYKISLALSALSWFAAVFILLLNDPLPRVKLLLGQIITLILSTIFVPVLAITYSFFIYSGPVATSVKLAWIGGTALFAYITLSLVLKTFILPLFDPKRYPGFMSAPFLFGLLIANYVAWHWVLILQVIKLFE